MKMNDCFNYVNEDNKESSSDSSTEYLSDSEDNNMEKNVFKDLKQKCSLKTYRNRPLFTVKETEEDTENVSLLKCSTCFDYKTFLIDMLLNVIIDTTEDNRNASSGVSSLDSTGDIESIKYLSKNPSNDINIKKLNSLMHSIPKKPSPFCNHNTSESSNSTLNNDWNTRAYKCELIFGHSGKELCKIICANEKNVQDIKHANSELFKSYKLIETKYCNLKNKTMNDIRLMETKYENTINQLNATVNKLKLGK